MIRVALAGHGFSGRTFHAPLIQATPGLELSLVLSRSDFQHALEHEGIDLVVIATPNETHFRLAEAALKAGKHVVVDKPFATTVTEAQALVAMAAEQGRILSVFQNRRWDSDFLGAKAMIESGQLGDIVHFESHTDRYRPLVRARWREQAGPGAGLWFDLGPHLVDQALQLFGPPVSVLGKLARQRPGAEVDDWFHVILDYGRLQVILHASMLAAEPAPRFVIHGSKGTWTKRHGDVQEEQLRSGMTPGASGWGEDPETAVFVDGETGQRIDVPVPAGDYRNYYAALRDAIMAAGPNPVTPQEALAVMDVLEAVANS